MKATLVYICIAFLFTLPGSQKYDCLPADIKEDLVVSYRTVTSDAGVQSTSPVTVGQTLSALKAKCSCKTLLDETGKEIRFYRMKGCWGAPPPDYLEIMEKQRTDIEALRAKFTVIEITCSTGSSQRIS